MAIVAQTQNASSLVNAEAHGWSTVSTRLAGVFSEILAEDFEMEVGGSNGAKGAIYEIEASSEERDEKLEVISTVAAWRNVSCTMSNIFRSALDEEMKSEKAQAGNFTGHASDSSTSEGTNSGDESSDSECTDCDGDFGDDEGAKHNHVRAQNRRRVANRHQESKAHTQRELKAWQTVSERLASVFAAVDSEDDEDFA